MQKHFSYKPHEYFIYYIDILETTFNNIYTNLVDCIHKTIVMENRISSDVTSIEIKSFDGITLRISPLHYAEANVIWNRSTRVKLIFIRMRTDRVSFF